MEADIQEPRQAEAGRDLVVRGEKSPAGSVKRARQRAAAGMPSQPPQMPPIQYPRSPPQQGLNPADRSRDPQSLSPEPYQSRNVPPRGSRPFRDAATPSGLQDSSRLRITSPRQDQNFPRGPAPQRPPRPNYVPPMPQTSQFQGTQQQPLQYYAPQSPESQPRNYWEDSFNEPTSSSRPLTTSTTSTSSSAGSIPDFPSIPLVPPAPLFQPPPRRNLGPPPSARKGGSSYYSQTSFVPPIPEEMSETHSSYASSHVMPESWVDGPPGYYMGGGIDEEDEDDAQGGNSGRGSSAGDHDDSSGLVRKGSQGKSRAPFLETLDSEDESERGPHGMRELDWQAKQDQRWRTGPHDTDPIGRHNFRADGRLNPQLYSGYESDATFLDSPRTQSPMPNLNASSHSGVHPYFGTPSSGGSPVDPRVGQILGHLEKGGALASSGTVSPSPAPSEKEFRRPPALNLGGSKEVSGRGSATSLPELIRRATKLASNLDRGRTASRIGMLDMLNAKEKESKESKEKAAKGDGSISDILAAFPSPSPTTPTPQRPSGWPTPSPHGKSALSRSQTPGYGSSVSRGQQRRKCCGLPVWAFILLLIILLLLIAAAVIIPITLIVIPRQHRDNSPSLDSCQTNMPCGNGGTSIVVSKSCRCICANGFTGSSCNMPTDAGCTTTDIPLYSNATLGNSIPRLLNAAQTNFSIPLTSPTILSLFSATNLSCASEDALVTFSQKSQRRDTLQVPLPELLSHQDPILLSLDEVLSPPTQTNKNTSKILHARASAQTTNGIIFAAPTVDSGGGTAPPSATNAASPTSTSNERPVTQRVLDFARTAILFILQETSSLTETQTALDHLQATLSGKTTFDATQTSAGGNITVDLSALTVGFGNGTLYGGKGAS